MKEQLITEIQRRMLPYLNNEQLLHLKNTLTNTMQEIAVTYEASTPTANGKDALESFLTAKRIEGCSEKTLAYYQNTIEAMLSNIGKTAQQITTDDLRQYLTMYQVQRGSSKVTIDNIRRILSSFFSWLEDEDFIVKSPVRRIHKVKTAKVVKDTYTDEALELMRDNCTTERDLALIDLLASSGMRVGELVTLNREDINFNERECVVIGKGNKERLVYFDARTKIHLQNYLDHRTDGNPALFVTLKAPYHRLMIGGVETRLRELGKRLNIPKVHPHKFRRTMATTAIDKGMPIEQVQQLLGHQKIDTTMHYAMVKQQNVKLHIENTSDRMVALMNAWQPVKVSELGRVVTGKTPKTAIAENYGGDVLFLTPSDDMSVKYVSKTVKTLTEKGLLEVKNALLPPDAVCVSCIGSDLGKVVITTKNTVTNQQINSIIVDKERFDVSFVYYAMLILGKELNFISKTSTAVPIVNKSSFSSYEIQCPPLKQQKRIASILSAFDSKIECNQKINDNLAA